MDCSVCLCELAPDSTETLHCTHRICQGCYSKWRASCREAEVDFTCPCCRAVIQAYQTTDGPTPLFAIDAEMDAAFEEDDGWDCYETQEDETDTGSECTIDYPDEEDEWEDEDEDEY